MTPAPSRGGSTPTTQSPRTIEQELILTSSEDGQGGSGTQAEAREYRNLLKNTIRNCVIAPSSLVTKAGSEYHEIIDHENEMRRELIRQHRSIAETNIKLEQIKKKRTEAMMRMTKEDLNQTMENSLQLGLNILQDEFEEKATIISSEQEAREREIELLDLDDSAQDQLGALIAFNNKITVDDDEVIIYDYDETGATQEGEEMDQSANARTKK